MFFLRTGYFENLLKCEQVATYQPQVYNSFEDLSSDPDARIVSYQQPLEIMKSQPKGSIYRTIYETVVRSGFEKKPKTDEMMKFFMDRKSSHNKALISDLPRITDIACDQLRTLRKQGADTSAMEGLCYYEYIPGLDSSEKEFHETTFIVPHRAAHFDQFHTKEHIC